MIWVDVEEYDEETEEGETLPILDVASVATFDDPEEARVFATQLTLNGQRMADGVWPGELK